MISISLCMIVRNEEATLPKCLESVKDIADEIIIVDTGSEDRTKEIASGYTNNIFDFEWIQDFAAARNYSFSKATKEYLMWLDADDVLLEEDREKLKVLKESLEPEVDVVVMKYNVGSDEKGNSTCTFYRERLLRRSLNFMWFDPVHEYINFYGKIKTVDIAVTHKKTHPPTDRNLKIFEKMISDGKSLSHRNYFYYARELFINGRLDKAIEYYDKFMDTEDGLPSNYIDSSVDMSKCYLLKGDDKNALRSLFRSFEKGIPRAEVCCQVGYYYKEKKDYVKAVFWFEFAIKLQKPSSTWGSVNHDCWGYIPYMELCSCLYKIGHLKEALHYVNMALKCKPYDSIAQNNKKFIEYVINQKEKGAV